MSIPGTIRTLWHMFSRYRWHVLALSVLGFAGAIFEGVGINATIPLFSFFTGGAASTDRISQFIQGLFHFIGVPFTFRYLLFFILGLFILRAVVVTLFGYIRGWINADFQGDESENVLRQMFLASWPFLLRQKIGSTHNSLVRDIQRTTSLLDVIGQIIQSFSGFLMYLLVAINISPVITFCVIGAGAVLLFAIRPFLVRTQVTSRTISMTEKEYSQFLTEHIIGMKTIKASGIGKKALHTGYRMIQSLRSMSIRLAFIHSISTSLFQPFSIVFVIILFSLTYHSPTFSIVSFGAALYLIQKIFTYLESGQSALHSIIELVPYARSVVEFKKMLSDNREHVSSGDKPFSFAKTLSCEHLSFSYQDEKSVLKDISFTVAPGETLGFVGPSGAGKTTIADLLLRLFEPTQGKILLDGVPAQDIKIEEWRERIGYVSQDVFLLNDTIEQNIRLYRPSLTQEEILSAAKQANIYEFITTLPDGFQTTVGDRGVLLSGGQRQRIALARALAGSPAILILDEATSALDHESEQLIQEAIRSLHGNVTVCVIAHRPSTVADADQILVLDHGTVVERGAPQELMKHTSSYFYKMQHSV